MRNGSKEEQQKAKEELKTLVDPAMVEPIEKALNEIDNYTTKFHIKYERTSNESEFLALLRAEGVEVEAFSRDVLLILSDRTILELLIKPGYILLEDLMLLAVNTIKAISKPDIVELLVEQEMTFDEVVEIYSISSNEDEFLIRLRCQTEDPVEIALYLAPEVDRNSNGIFRLWLYRLDKSINYVKVTKYLLH
ncbi:MAG UNVERIFIED_CONTAM: hypothetical protein LVQ98_08270 [Rickettsiaceae bacterium]|jgi:hypothetical protein